MTEDKNIIKEHFEYIIGFLALVISLNGFKSELEAININLGFTQFTLAQYFLVVILATILALHFYFLPQFFPSKEDKSLIRKYLRLVCYIILFQIAISPFLLTGIYLLNQIKIPKIPFSLDVVGLLLGLLTSILYSVYSGRKKGMELEKQMLEIYAKKQALRDEMLKQEIREQLEKEKKEKQSPAN